MEYRSVGGSDSQVSTLSLGTATFGGGNTFFRHEGRNFGGHIPSCIVTEWVSTGLSREDRGHCCMPH